jgi:hypothetical protein
MLPREPWIWLGRSLSIPLMTKKIVEQLHTYPNKEPWLLHRQTRRIVTSMTQILQQKKCRMKKEEAVTQRSRENQDKPLPKISSMPRNLLLRESMRKPRWSN